LSHPWRGLEYEIEYEQVWQYVRTNRECGHPTLLSEAVKHVHGRNYTNTEYRRVARLVKRCDWFHVVDCGSYYEVEPTLKALGLESAVSDSQKRKTGSGSEIDATQTVESSDPTTGPTVGSGDRGQQYPKDRAGNVLEKRVRLDDHGDYVDQRDGLLRELAQYREDTADKFTVLGNRVRDEYLLIPYQTRFNARHKAKESMERFTTALDRAAEGFQTASVLTLTPNPNRFESHTEATEAVTDGVANLKSCLRYRTGGFEAVPVLDFQRNGLPHYHIVLFGVTVVDESNNESGDPTVSEAEIREYWDSNAGIGSQVAVQPAWKGRNGTWLLHNDDKKVSLRYYLGKRIRELLRVATLDESELWDKVESGDIELWRHALFWVYEKQYVSCSESLKESDGDRANGDGDDLPYVPEWRYVGTAKFGQIPTHILNKAIVCRPAGATPG
jgi:hypothetical protein